MKGTRRRHTYNKRRSWKAQQGRRGATGLKTVTCQVEVKYFKWRQYHTVTTAPHLEIYWKLRDKIIWRKFIWNWTVRFTVPSEQALQYVTVRRRGWHYYCKHCTIPKLGKLKKNCNMSIDRLEARQECLQKQSDWLMENKGHHEKTLWGFSW